MATPRPSHGTQLAAVTSAVTHERATTVATWPAGMVSLAVHAPPSSWREECGMAAASSEAS